MILRALAAVAALAALRGAAAAAAPVPTRGGGGRRLQQALLPPLPLDTGGLPITIPLPFGTPGTPAAPARRGAPSAPDCANPKPTLVLIPGISGSQLDGTQTGEGPGCPSFSAPRAVWADVSWMRNLACFAHMMSVRYDAASRRFANSTGTALWPHEGGWPDGTAYLLWRLYYNPLWRALVRGQGYRLGVDLFAAPYDWRLGFDGLEQVGAFDQMAARVEAAVRQNCGQRAVIISHSMGVNVALRLLRHPRLGAWRRANVRGLVQIGGAFAGASATLWETKLSGTLNPYPAFLNALPPQLVAALPTFPLEAAVYEFSLGMPSGLVLLPTGMAEGRDHVVVATRRRNYTVAQQGQLLRDMGDEQSALLLDASLAANRELLAAGPVPGVETFCVYGTAVPTPLTLVYDVDALPRRAPLRRPAAKVLGPGDGSMSLATLRLCSMLAPVDHLVEITDPTVDHAGVVSQPNGLAVLLSVLGKFWAAPDTGPAAAGPGARGPQQQAQQQQQQQQQPQQQPRRSGWVVGGKGGKNHVVFAAADGR
ncbi:hypothetical protein HT031_002443 [Scenedesmus sp. PABB004]|nr:hypothetical protein HT031_002443 [Scenedesmus sp. PABB004]